MVDVAVSRAEVTRTRVASYSWIWIPLGIFAFTRVVATTILLLMAHDQVARVGSPTLHVVDPAPASPGYFDLLTNWDGQWYQDVAQNGYPAHLPRDHGQVTQNSWAFYPLYPLLVRLVMTLTALPFAVAASLVSMVAGGAAMVLVFRLLEERVGRFNAGMTVLALSLAPAGVLWQAAYTESLALLLVVASLLLLTRRRYLALTAAAVALSLTRPIVLPLTLVIGLHGLRRWRRRDSEPFPVEERRRWLVALLGSGASFALWPVICAVRTGEPGAYLETQKAWITRISGASSWVVAMVQNPTGRASLIAVTVMLAAIAIVARPAARAWGSELRWWVPSYGLYLLFTASPVASSLRYALLTVVPWWPFTDNSGALTRYRKTVMVAFAIAFGVITQVAWVRYFYVLGPDQVMFP